MSIYSTLVSDKLVQTVNFYEDHFGFIPVIEKDGYVMLQSKDNVIAVFDAHHECVYERIKPVQGLILNIQLKNVEEIYNRLYMEGLEIYKELGQDINGKKHFVVYDPNGVLVNIHEPIDIRELELA